MSRDSLLEDHIWKKTEELTSSSMGPVTVIERCWLTRSCKGDRSCSPPLKFPNILWVCWASTNEAGCLLILAYCTSPLDLPWLYHKHGHMLFSCTVSPRFCCIGGQTLGPRNCCPIAVEDFNGTVPYTDVSIRGCVLQLKWSVKAERRDKLAYRGGVRDTHDRLGPCVRL